MNATPDSITVPEKVTTNNSPTALPCRILTLNELQRPHAAGTLIKAGRGAYLVMPGGVMRKVDILSQNGTEVTCVPQQRMSRKDKKALKRRRHQ